MKTMMLTAATLFGLTGAAIAANDAALSYDTDKDGFVTLAELQEVHPDMTVDAFNQADADADGLLNADEVTMAETDGLIPEEAAPQG